MIALQRLNGSVKKVKGTISVRVGLHIQKRDVGSLADKSVRLPMDHVIFRKLKDAVERPCRIRDW